MSHTAYVAIGTNLGDRVSNFKTAVTKVAGIEDTRVTGQSSLYESEPHGRARNWFLNGVVEIITEIEARPLLKALQAIEDEMGRKRAAEKTTVSRIIDLDILLFDNQIIKSRPLKIPHPEVPNRRFVLLPLSELAPSLTHPELGNTVSAMLSNTEDKKRVVLFRG